ncbi:MAG TPA: hypothetical protein VFK02_32755 [Kofleriaceae bacterium]|nr:hypothetical protein [Kofleriaceae bacterium]
MPETTKLITYLACPADAAAEKQGPLDGNLALEAFDELFTSSVKNDPKKETRYERTASLLAIARSLSKLRHRPEVIQIVGHGAPGMLALGYYWDSKYTDTDQGPFYLLDSNPYAYGILEPFVRPPTRVILAGCNVGSNHSSRLVARGSSLIFDLHAMWGCDVLAADGLVGPENFAADGRYIGSAQGYVSGRWVHAHGHEAPRFATKQVRKFQFRNVALKEIPALGATPGRTILPKIDTSAITDPANGYARELDVDSTTTPKAVLLAMNEVSFTGVDELGHAVDLHLICNGQYLKVVKRHGNGSKFRLFTTQEPNALTIDALYNAAVHPGQKIWEQIKIELASRMVA